MIISHRHKLIFFSAPKTGSETIREHLLPISDHPVLDWITHRSQTEFYPHMPPVQARALFQQKGFDFDAYRRVTCIRDPFERLVSLYRMSQTAGRAAKLRAAVRLPAIPFETWLARHLDPGWRNRKTHQKWREYGLWPARRWCQDAEGQTLITDLIPTPKIDLALPILLESVGCPAPAQIVRKNVNAKTDARAWYGAQGTRLVEARFGWDLAFLASEAARNSPIVKLDETNFA